MAVTDHVDLSTFIEGVKKRNPGQPEFVQAVQGGVAVPTRMMQVFNFHIDH